MANKPGEITKKLETQVNEMLSLYDLAEQAYPYQQLRGGERPLNEDTHRREMVAFSNYGNGSAQISDKGAMPMGLLSMYLFSRRGAKHLFDFSTMRTCFTRTFSWYMIGYSFCTFLAINRVAKEAHGGNNLCL